MAKTSLPWEKSSLANIARDSSKPILGTDAIQQLDMMQDENTLTKKMLMGIDPSESLPESSLTINQRDIDTMRQKTLEWPYALFELNNYQICIKL